MDTKFWEQVWNDGKINFNQSQPNAFLKKYQSLFHQEKMVFVPLCGKSVDMNFLLENGFPITGIDCVTSALKEFFEDQGIKYSYRDHQNYQVFQQGKVRLFCFDYFKGNLIQEKYLNFYDRGAFVAIPKDQRELYLKTLVQFLEAEATGLMIIVEFHGDIDFSTIGPPYHCTKEEFEKLIEGNFKYQLKESSKNKTQSSRLQENGIREITKHVYQLTSI